MRFALSLDEGAVEAAIFVALCSRLAHLVEWRLRFLRTVCGEMLDLMRLKHLSTDLSLEVFEMKQESSLPEMPLWLRRIKIEGQTSPEMRALCDRLAWSLQARLPLLLSTHDWDSRLRRDLESLITPTANAANTSVREALSLVLVYMLTTGYLSRTIGDEMQKSEAAINEVESRIDYVAQMKGRTKQQATEGASGETDWARKVREASNHRAKLTALLAQLDTEGRASNTLAPKSGGSAA